MHKAKCVASRFIDLAQADNRSLTHTQIASLVYIAHGWYLGLFKRGLIEDRIYAMQSGPIIISLHHIDNGPVDSEPKSSDDSEVTGFDARETGLIEAVYESYRAFSGYQLRLLTRSEDTPWALTWNNGAGQNNVIADGLIQQHYAGMACGRMDFSVVA